ncbi:SRPBCC family protein [Saccharopolyspora mangrovi]|uniref:SRPBCC family protein n=1 Tax=Saccharopolyspora mangrovi TaxID=3082379 RepID=A0ABU6AKE1_9PSEU|nr:SRPBCC family protein [Saccharopolyspora sp. S2-29]MEB3371980.1 SRPBCC family protein [Saccharopolyspora sp. S2-29]
MAETDQRDKSLTDELPLDRLKEAGQELLEAVVSRAVGSATGKVTDLTDRLTSVADNGGSGLTAALTGAKDLAEGKSPMKAALGAGIAGAKDKVKQAVGGGGGGGSSDAKVVNIIEEFDVGIPLRVAYNQWTTFEDFPSFTRKVEKVEQESDEKITWRAQIFFSHRDWESTIVEQVPDERIVWKSTGAKGYVDGAVTFHELAPTMTRVLLVCEYYPQGFFEKTANLWRAQGRRVRSDFKHIKRHMMTRTILDQEEVEGWRGEIRDEEVVKTHEEALDEEDEADGTEETDEGEDFEDEYETEDEEEEERVPAQASRKS